MSAQPRWSRGEFLRRAAAAGTGVALAGTPAYGLDRLIGRDGSALAAPAAVSARGVQRFYSNPALQPPQVTVVQQAVDVAPGYLFLSPASGPWQHGALMIDDAGEVVWFHPARKTIKNFRAALYRGNPVLTWWEGEIRPGLEIGEHVILDRSYREIARFPSGNGRPADLHELLITPRNTALVTSYEVARRDLGQLGGSSRGKVVGGIAQELEIPSGRVLFEWQSLRHVALDESHVRPGGRFDYFHINSIDLLPDGNWLISARNTWAVYKVDRASGKVLWRLGGKKSDFAMGKGTFFAFQHDARAHQGGTLISLFDNGATPRVQPQSHALFIALDLAHMQATLARDYVHDPPLLARYRGSVQELPNGNVLVGWGTEPWFTEYAADGSVRLDARLPFGGESYRVLRFPWQARPVNRPRLAAHSVDGERALYASWNGATELVAWELRVGGSPGGLRAAGTTPRSGFETKLALPQGARNALVVALDGAGKPLGHSEPVPL